MTDEMDFRLMQTAKGMLERSFDALGFDAKQRRAFCRSATVDQYLADVDPNNAPHGLCYHSRAESGPWLRSMMHSLNVIRGQRKRQQYHREQSFLEDIGRASRLWAESALSIAIPSLSATVQWKKRVEHYVVVSKSSVNKYDQRTIINVPVYWGKMVHQRGLSYVGHKGQNIFILYAKSRARPQDFVQFVLVFLHPASSGAQMRVVKNKTPIAPFVGARITDRGART